MLRLLLSLALAAVVAAWLARGSAWAAVLLTMCASSAITVAILAQTALPGFAQPTTLRSWLLGSDFLAGAGLSSGSAADIPIEYATRPSVTWELRGLQGHPEQGTVRRPWRSFVCGRFDWDLPMQGLFWSRNIETQRTRVANTWEPASSFSDPSILRPLNESL